MLDRKKKAIIFTASLTSGFAIGFATEFVCGKIRKAKEDEACTDDFDEDWDEEEPLDIPEGVNVLEEAGESGIVIDKVVNDQMFVKPDISKMVDYTKYADVARNYSKEQEINLSDIVMPDDEDAPEAFDDARFELIDEAEFVKEIGNGNGYVSATGTYFVQDKVLAGWNEDLMEKDISNTVGWRAIAMFDSPDVKAVYVRNLELKVLYEIVRCDDLMESVVNEIKIAEVSEVQEE